MTLAVETHDLTRTYGAFRAVDGLELAVPEGSVFGFLGPNGAGKTTTIRLLLGLLEPTRGEARVLGLAVREGAERIRAQVGVVLDQPGVYTRLSAADNLWFFSAAYGVPPDQRRERAAELLRRVGLWERRHERVAGFSRGMQQKLAFARAIMHHPRLVFLDEPTAGLDVESAAAVREDILHLARAEGATIFLTTHNLDEVERVCDRVAVIKQGRLLVTGSPGELRQAAGRPRVSIRATGLDPGIVAALRNEPTVAAVDWSADRLEVALRDSQSPAVLVKLLVERGVGVEEVRSETGTLEDAFLALLKEDERG